MNDSTATRPGVPEDVQLAAGGLVWDRSTTPPRLAVIHRRKYGDWTLPKGKPEGTETPLQTARREVQEEVGGEFQVEDFAGTTWYRKGGRPKVVFFWNMTRLDRAPFQPNREVDQVLWLTAAEALAKLSHASEREFLAQQRR